MKFKKNDSKGFFPESWYVAKIINEERTITRYGHRLLVWFEIKNEHGRTMNISEFFPATFTNDNRLGHLAKTVLGEKIEEFNSRDMVGCYITVNVKKKQKSKTARSYLNIVAYKRFIKAHLDQKSILAPKTHNTPPPSQEATPEQVAEMLKNKAFAEAVTKALKKPKKKNEPKSMGENMDNLKKGMED
jgi:hypothetical protein